MTASPLPNLPALLQHGVFTWTQLQRAGWNRDNLRRAMRQRLLSRVHPEVYVDHTGPLTPPQRGWAAVLWGAPAALCGPSVLGVQPDACEVHIAINRDRNPAPPPGIRVHRAKNLTAMIRPGATPPRLALEHNALLLINGASSETEVVATLTETIGRLGTTANSIRRALELHPRLPRIALVRALLDDIEMGTESVLEHGFLNRVERPHSLPEPQRQARRLNGRERRDLEYADFGLVVELDGRLNHASWAHGNRDARRDLADLASGRSVLRLRWRQVMEQPCQTASLLAKALQARGWDGKAQRCRACPK